MKHFLLLVIALLLGSPAIEADTNSSPIKLSVLRKNTGKIVRSTPLDITFVSAYIDNKMILLNFNYLPDDLQVFIFDKNGTLIHSDIINSPNMDTTINVSTWNNGEYRLYITNHAYIDITGYFHLE